MATSREQCELAHCVGLDVFGRGSARSCSAHAQVSRWVLVILLGSASIRLGGRILGGR